MIALGDQSVPLCRYDVELFQKIEVLTGQKMEKFPADEDAALVLLDRVSEAQAMATMQVSCTLSPPFPKEGKYISPSSKPKTSWLCCCYNSKVIAACAEIDCHSKQFSVDELYLLKDIG